MQTDADLRENPEGAALRWLQRHVAGNRFLPVPPSELQFVGDGDFRAIGAEFLGRFVRAGLRPDDRVLDIGCGVGRMAVPLTQFLSPQGSYDGVDIVEAGIAWCRTAIGAVYGNFRFHHLDLRHPLYNPAGAPAAEPVRLAFPDAGFDFAIMTSVITHLRAAEVVAYAGELGRLLRPGGRALVSLFLMNGRARGHIRRTAPRLRFDPDAPGPEFHAFPDAPLAAVA